MQKAERRAAWEGRPNAPRFVRLLRMLGYEDAWIALMLLQPDDMILAAVLVDWPGLVESPHGRRTLQTIESALRDLREDEVTVLRTPNRGGAPGGTGLTWESLLATTVAGREADGTWPTEAKVAYLLGLSEERIRQVARAHGGWRALLAAAEERVGDAKV